MNVDPSRAVCRSCGGPLQIIDERDASATVACVECSDTYEIDTEQCILAAIVPADTMDNCPMEEADGSERYPA